MTEKFEYKPKGGVLSEDVVKALSKAASSTYKKWSEESTPSSALSDLGNEMELLKAAQKAGPNRFERETRSGPATPVGPPGTRPRDPSRATGNAAPRPQSGHKSLCEERFSVGFSRQASSLSVRTCVSSRILTYSQGQQ